uniref:WASH complex subunit FAM21 n=1 Tax=Anthurium amnicola TaxID=1678845 RepID=A0A1D1XM07_9ARAE
MEPRNSAGEPVKKRLSMQNEILKRVEELAGRMQRRAEEVTREVRDLEGRAGAAERDLEGAFNAFRRLSDTHFVENIISEEDQISRTKGGSKTSVDRNIPAQSYELDILPRYKEAVSLGLKSYKDHLKRANKSYSGSSASNVWSVRGPLPHIIGSEEYIHDNSCGLIGPNDLFNPNLFGMEQGPSEEDGNKPLVSAALDFKAMLEAALRSPYKFHDEGSSSHAIDPNNTWTAHTDQATLVSNNVRIGSSRDLQCLDGTTTPIREGNHLSFEDSDIHADNISALMSGSLFDPEEATLGGKEQLDNLSNLVEQTMCGSTSVADEKGSTGSTSSSPIQRNLDLDYDSSPRHPSSDTLLDGCMETGGQETSLEGFGAKEEVITYHTHVAATDNVVEDTRLSAIDNSSAPDVTKYQ